MIVHERISAYIQSLESELPSGLGSLERQALADGVPIIKKETQSFLRFMVQMLKPRRILEVGTAVGFSALFMSEYMPSEGRITTIEKMPIRIEKAKLNFAAAENKTHNITLLEGDALAVLKDLVKEEQTYDFIFMDAAKGQYLNFLPEIMKLLTYGGILITDNVLQDGTVAESRFGITRRDRTIHYRMRDYLYELTHRDDLSTSVIPIGDGVTVSTRIK